MFKYKRNMGFGLIEIIVGATIISVSFFVLLGVTRNALVLSRETSRSIRAAFLMEEGLEAVRILRDRSWATEIASLTVDTEYNLYFNGTTWVSTTTPEVIDGIFTRTFVVRNVNRDASDDIAETGTLDPGTRKIEVDVAWTSARGNQKSESASTYLTNFTNE
ncbi:MAG TPA: hypothetical protein VJJ24_02995 [Candidatus Paceibacterota bacterium]